MDHLRLALLGLIQGLTEFLPVSSSGHLVLAERLLGGDAVPKGALVEALLHCGTLVPVLLVFRGPLRGLLAFVRTPARWRRAPDAPDPDRELFGFLFVGSLATVVVVVPLLDVVERWFASTGTVAVGLGLTTVLLALSRLLPGGERDALTPLQAVIVGLAQGCAVLPGLSRSGTTLVVGLLVGVRRERLGACSMLLSVPPILGGALLEVVRHGTEGPGILPCLLGMVVAGVSGWFAIRWTLAFLRQGRLHWFAPYTALLALAAWWAVAA